MTTRSPTSNTAISRTRRQSQPVRPQRKAFTLVELLTVVMIIAILVALIMPAIFRVRQNVLLAAVRQDISQFEQALSQFKTLYGAEPPSRLRLWETATGWQNTDPETLRSKALIRRFWPQFNFGIDRPNLDLNTATNSSPIDMKGGECLTFFTAGIITWTDSNGNGSKDSGEFLATGFAKNPADPFSTVGNRDVPSIEFSANRFVDTNGNGMLEYLDSYPGQTVPLMYVSAYEGKGYDLADLASTNLTSPYRYPLGTGVPKYHKPQTYQIISPGPDASFGTGGAFDPDNVASSLLLIPTVGAAPTYTVTEAAGAATVRAAEWDNITSFHPGALKP